MYASEVLLLSTVDNYNERVRWFSAFTEFLESVSQIAELLQKFQWGCTDS
jgi:hypothetical protein